MSEMDWSKWNEYNQQVIAEFRANAGKVGGQFEGAPMLLLTHVGRKSGQDRVTPLVHGQTDAGECFIVASKAGAPTDPDWFRNITENPQVTVEVGTEKFQAHARVTANPEREQLFERMAAAMPNFNDYKAKTDREIPVVVLERKA